VSSVRHRRAHHKTIQFRYPRTLAATDPQGAPSISLGPPLAIAADKADLLDLNTSTAEQYKALPDFSEACSEKIIKYRPHQ